VSICERSGIAVLVGCAAALLTLVRCAPTESCLRLSDCDVGMTCVSGACTVVVASSDGEGGTLEGGAPVATPVATTDATASAPDSATKTDAAVAVDAGGDAATIVDSGEIDTSDF
jgi:hypothetical protein